MIGAGVTVIATIWLVIATRFDHMSRYVAKPVASLGFLLVVVLGSFEPGSRPGLLLAGLALGAAGDVTLMASSEIAFLGGLVLFLLGHVTYLLWFLSVAGPASWIIGGIVLATATGAWVLRWLVPHLEGPFTLAVPIYVVVICLMLAAAIAGYPAAPLAATGAVVFAISDIFVARHRFVASGAVNATLGLPLYYAAQLAIAASIVVW